MRGILILLMITFFGCTNPNSGTDSNKSELQVSVEIQALYDEVIAVHDEVMPKMSKTVSLKSKVDEKSKVTQDSIVILDLNKLSTRLSEADEEMMNWMRHFNADILKGDQQLAKKYLLTERTKITQVAENINVVLEDAEVVLD